MSMRTKEYILTESGNRISRLGLNLVNTQSIVLGGKTIIESHVTIRGDLKRSRTTGRGAGMPGSESAASGAASGGRVGGIDAAVSVGRYCLLSQHCVLSPPYKIKPSADPSGLQILPSGRRDQERNAEEREEAEKMKEGVRKCQEEEKVYYPLKMGDYVFIGPNARIEAALISSCVHIGADVVIGNMCIIKEGCVIEDGAVVPAYTVLPPLSRVSGQPGLVRQECPEVMPDVIRDRLRENYARVVAVK